MPEFDKIEYSRKGTIRAISDYYDFLPKMYMHESQIIRPPLEGWPSIVHADPEILRSLGKSDEVLSLLAHLPYIHNPSMWEDMADAAPGCLFADWNNLIEGLANPRKHFDSDMLRVVTEGPSFVRFSNPHAFGLTCGGRENPVMILDTKRGIVHWEQDSCPGHVTYGPTTVFWETDEDDSLSEAEAAWRAGGGVWSIPDFFEMLKDQFKCLRWVPASSRTVYSWEPIDGSEIEGMVSMLQEIYREHHWPDLEMYQKTECLHAVRQSMELKYPDYACSRGD